MKGILGALRFAFGKEAGAWVSGKNLIGRAWTTAKASPISKMTAHNSWQSLKLQGILAGATLLMPGSTEEKMQGLALNLGTAFMTMGMNSPWRQFGWSTAFTMMPHMGSITRGIVQGYRGALESRTSLSIPFSHSSLAMDQAFATLQYSKQRMSDAYSTVGSEAGFMAARYLSRG